MENQLVIWVTIIDLPRVRLQFHYTSCEIDYREQVTIAWFEFNPRSLIWNGPEINASNGFVNVHCFLRPLGQNGFPVWLQGNFP